MDKFNLQPKSLKVALTPHFLDPRQHPYCGTEIDITAFLGDLGDFLFKANKAVDAGMINT